MDHLSNGYSSSSASSSSHESNRESDDADDFHVISVSQASNVQSQRQETDATNGSASHNGHEESDDAKISSNQLKKIERWIAFVETSTPGGQSFTEIVRRNKNFRNPAIFEKMISYCGIDQFGTNIKGRKPLQEGDFYADIRETQELCMDATNVSTAECSRTLK